MNRTRVYDWLLPVGSFLAVVTLLNGLRAGALGPTAGMQATRDAKTGQLVIREGNRLVLQYNYNPVPPPDGYLEDVPERLHKYAVVRSDYIHPLYGPEGEVLTEDWSPDHPHHRGVYWAWPEVDFGQQRGDLHAMQQVFAHPTGNIQWISRAESARIEAENIWMWEDRTPIVQELVTIVAHQTVDQGQSIDLRFQFTAIVDGVKLARRDTDTYGGLNIRLASAKDLKLSHHVDTMDSSPCYAWSDAVGVWGGATKPIGLAVFEKTTNPDYPADFVKYDNLPWFQPAFPRAGKRTELIKGKPLILEYRFWIRSTTNAAETEFRSRWQEFNTGKQ